MKAYRYRLSAVVAVLLGLGLPLPSAMAQNECRQAAIRMYIAGLFDAQDDYFESLAKAQNLEDDAAVSEAEEEAREERDEAQEENRAVYAERLRLCEELDEDKYLPEIDPADFLSAEEIAANPNPYWPMVPGRTWTYEGESEDGVETIVVTITDDTRDILDVECIVVLDVVTLEGELIEETYDWYAQDRDGNVWYFGEETFEYEDGRVVSIDGSFQAGEEGAEAGILFKADPAVGDLYRQEFLLGDAEDVALVWGLNATRTVPYGTFSGCIKTAEWNPLEPGELEFKYYAHGVGMILEEDPESGETVALISVSD